MPVDKFGRTDTADQDNVSSYVSFTQMNDFLKEEWLEYRHRVDKYDWKYVKKRERASTRSRCG